MSALLSQSHNNIDIHNDTYVVCQHECSRLNDKLVRFLIFHNGSRQTCSSAGLATGVHSSRTELLHLPSTSTAVTRDQICNTLNLQFHKHIIYEWKEIVIMLLALSKVRDTLIQVVNKLATNDTAADIVTKYIYTQIFLLCPSNDRTNHSFRWKIKCYLANGGKNRENLLQKVALCSTWITNNTDIDISSEVCAFLCNFMNATKQHQQNSTFHLIITCT